MRDSKVPGRRSSSLITGASLIASGRVPKTVRTLIIRQEASVDGAERAPRAILARPGDHGLVDGSQPLGELGPAVPLERPFAGALAEPLAALLVGQELDQRLAESSRIPRWNRQADLG